MDYSPRETMDLVLKRWLVVVLFTFAGGAAGWIFHQLQPPIYEARAVFVMSINYNQPDLLDSLDGDHYAEDQMISAAIDLLISSSVISQVTQDSAALNLAPGDISLGERVFIERRQADVSIIVRHEDPEKAAGLANLWAKHGLAALQEAQSHALKVYTLNYQIKGLEACPLEQANPSPLCQFSTRAELEAELSKLQGELQTEIQSSRGLVPALMFDLSRLAVTPTAPMLYQTQGLVLAGGLLGFLIGLLLSILKVR